jgi:hypothetical protein
MNLCHVENVRNAPAVGKTIEKTQEKPDLMGFYDGFMGFYGGLRGSNGNSNGIWLVVEPYPSEKI